MSRYERASSVCVRECVDPTVVCQLPVVAEMESSLFVIILTSKRKIRVINIIVSSKHSFNILFLRFMALIKCFA